MRCNKCGEIITTCDNCSMQFGRKGTSIYCMVMKEGSNALVFEDKKKAKAGKREHHHYCSAECAKESGADAQEAELVDDY